MFSFEGSWGKEGLRAGKTPQKSRPIPCLNKRQDGENLFSIHFAGAKNPRDFREFKTFYPPNMMTKNIEFRGQFCDKKSCD